MKNNSDKDLSIVSELTETFFEKVGTSSKVSVSFDDKESAYNVSLDSKDEAGLLIGNRGETLNSLQSILGMMVRQKLGEWHRVNLNVSDWKEKQESRLKEMAVQTAQRVVQTGEDQFLYNLSAAERRVVHMALSEVEEVETESFGEGSERYLVVKLKK